MGLCLSWLKLYRQQVDGLNDSKTRDNKFQEDLCFLSFYDVADAVVVWLFVSVLDVLLLLPLCVVVVVIIVVDVAVVVLLSVCILLVYT